MRRVPDLRIQVAPLIVSVILSRSRMSRRGLARTLLQSIVPELPIRSGIFAPEGCLSQVAGSVTGSSDNTNILFAGMVHHYLTYLFHDHPISRLMHLCFNISFPPSISGNLDESPVHIVNLYSSSFPTVVLIGFSR